ncbi:MAG: hypothetical protein ISP01_01850 [Methanobrevibacter arboriphilus]|uniref:Uncharacterized protein n=1 Tax=Methanobrevibacter arboriphilus TaxID=39441 RepID=A0A843A9Y1_METAZ|nr:hypothetical protein [Methanobrevibacter arboriphilus]MBF4468127.1 hypothetical protein [Methanobrevibacter arboriphilus]
MLEKINSSDLLEFDNLGNLKVGCHECNFNDFVKKFLDEFPDSETRSSRMYLFKSFLKNFNANVKSTRKYLINGGFTTNKNNPCDVDFVIVLNGSQISAEENEFLNLLMDDVNKIRIPYKLLEKEIEEEGRSKRELMETEFYDYGCDFYYLVRIEADDEDYHIYQDLKEYWMKWWGHTRKDKKTGVKHPKGFIDIKHEENMLEGLS